MRGEGIRSSCGGNVERRRTIVPLLIAHRGASGVAPESTRAALRAAVAAGARMVELDVQMTQDERLIIFHDDRLERTTNGTGRVRQRRYAELAALDAGAWFHRRFTGERILLVSQVLRLLPQRMRINLELKRASRRQALLRRVLRLFDRVPNRRHRLLISAVDPHMLRPLRCTGIPLALIGSRHPEPSLRRAIRLRVSAWHPHHALVTPARIATAHAHGLRVHAWTVDDPVRARQLLRWGVDGLFTNHPARLCRLFGGHAS